MFTQRGGVRNQVNLHHFHIVSKRDLTHETERYKHQAVIMGISNPRDQVGGQTNGSLTSALVIDHP